MSTFESLRLSATAAHIHLYLLRMLSVEETDNTTSGSLPYSLQ